MDKKRIVLHAMNFYQLPIPLLLPFWLEFFSLFANWCETDFLRILQFYTKKLKINIENQPSGISATSQKLIIVTERIAAMQMHLSKFRNNWKDPVCSLPILIK